MLAGVALVAGLWLAVERILPGGPRPHRAAAAPAVVVPRARSTGEASLAARSELAVRRFVRMGLPLYCGGARGRYVALTFDDGPGPYTRLALRILRHAGAQATFFLVGKILAHSAWAVRAELRNAALGDHTWTHPYLPALTPTQVRGQLVETRALIERDGAPPVRLFRPPYGAHDRRIDVEARRLGLLEVLWSVDTRDSEGANWSAIAAAVRRGLHPGAIVLMHENRGQAIEALKFAILPLLHRRRYRAVTIPQLLALDPPGARQLRGFCFGERLVPRTAGG